MIPKTISVTLPHLQDGSLYEAAQNMEYLDMVIQESITLKRKSCHTIIMTEDLLLLFYSLNFTP